MQFWQELEDLLGPILGPIVRGIFEPVYRTFENSAFRTQFLSAVIWTAMIVGGLVFVVYEAPAFFSWITGSQTSSPRRRETTRQVKSAQRLAADRRIASQDKVVVERERRLAVMEASGVKVQSRIKQQQENLLLSVIVSNGSDHHINMVVIDIDLPADINTSTGSFRMQRLGTIASGQTEIAKFVLQNMGGDISAIGGYVEFLSTSYEISKIPLPVPEIEE